MINKIVLSTSLVMMLTGLYLEYNTCDMVLYDKRNRLSIARNLKLLSIWILCVSISVFMAHNETIFRTISNKVSQYKRGFVEKQINNVLDSLQD